MAVRLTITVPGGWAILAGKARVRAVMRGAGMEVAARAKAMIRAGGATAKRAAKLQSKAGGPPVSRTGNLARGIKVKPRRMKALLLRAVVLARRRKTLAESTRHSYQRRLDRELNAIMVLAPTNSHGKRLRKRYGKVRSHLFTFLRHPEVPPDNNGSERELRPTATYRKVTGGFRSKWGADLFAGVRSVVGTAARRGNDAYQAIRAVLTGESGILPG